MNRRVEADFDIFRFSPVYVRIPTPGDSVLAALWAQRRRATPMTWKFRESLALIANRVDSPSGNSSRNSLDIAIAGKQSMSSTDFAAYRSTAKASDRGNTARFGGISNASHN